MFNIINTMPYLQTSREFPEDISTLVVEVNKSYLEIAQNLNARTIGLFSTNRAAITGEEWFITSRKQQSLRQVYNVPSGIITGSTIDIGFKIANISQFSPKTYGVFTNGTDWYGLIFASNVSIAGQISFFLHVNPGSTVSDQIVFEVGAGAPAITSGTIVLEWLAFV